MKQNIPYNNNNYYHTECLVSSLINDYIYMDLTDIIHYVSYYKIYLGIKVSTVAQIL